MKKSRLFLGGTSLISKKIIVIHCITLLFVFLCMAIPLQADVLDIYESDGVLKDLFVYEDVVEINTGVSRVISVDALPLVTFTKVVYWMVQKCLILR